MTDTSDNLYKLLYARPEIWTDGKVIMAVPVSYLNSGYTMYYRPEELLNTWNLLLV